MTTETLTARAGTMDPLPPSTVPTVARESGRPGPAGHGTPGISTALDVVIPVFNEQDDLEPAVRRLHAHLRDHLPLTFRITVADNASTDATGAIADALARELPGVRVVHLAEKGRGRALKQAWSDSDALVLAYMDVDLSTDLAALLPLIAPLISGHSDLAIGTRLHRGSRVVRGAKREVISRCYNLILRGTLSAHFSDAQCGFKAIRSDVARRLLPLVEDTGWFFDTELLVLAERSGLRIHEIPVDWVDDPHSSVDVLATAKADLQGVARVGRALAAGRLPLAQIRAQLGRAPLEPQTPGVPNGMVRQLVRFGAIGVLSTLAYLVLFVALRDLAGNQGANFLALAITAVANTAANRRLTFGVRGRSGMGRHHLQGFGVFLLGLAVTSGSLFALNHLDPAAGPGLEISVLVLANLVATVLRFLLLRGWVFRRSAPRPQVAPETAG
ncbi:bifunctional glycosyltransferase family 2/GtrA family protein [Nakamurella flavida]|uniref:dolichyl-phosphate beta-glucosyltransferase n=1 Tax=Nakamurella flavida TaxID=363630 RepID=A0A938YJC4_9ACTN|nr:bifunctional glycosyltransferase family 2/GtrA family protein [Nakamurella flavida]MBM9475661.1 bifunctional glycosyltransferase family 2/GtrA family protein [Nakamurella flavida]MDP9778061.1 putative flippase GtrA [Nakamurella flavida]